MAISEVIVQYKVKPDCAEENERLINAVFTALAMVRPQGICYYSYKPEDGQTFVHHAVASPRNGINPLQRLKAFMDFVRVIKERCAEPPAQSLQARSAAIKDDESLHVLSGLRHQEQSANRKDRGISG